MKYFFDTEFIEGFRKPLFGKRSHFIDLISIGIIAEDGRTYYAISNEFNAKDADKWVIENVINKLEQKATSFYDSPRLRQNGLLYKSNAQIAKDIIDFVEISWPNEPQKMSPEFYAYYADYDWVVFCSLFGRMIDLPKGFPMYCIDLKQMLDEKVKSLPVHSFEKDLEMAKASKRYPKEQNEHNALADAKWNYELFKYLNPKYKPFENYNSSI